MFLRVLARVRENPDMDLILQGIEGSEIAFLWRVKYIHVQDIISFEQLDKSNKTTLIYYNDGTPEIIKENVDEFSIRLEEKIQQIIELQGGYEEELILGDIEDSENPE